MTDDEDTIELSWYLRTLQRRWKAATAGALTGGVLAFAFASSLPLRYEGITTLLVVTPTQGDSAQVSATTFRGIVDNVSLASQIISELKLDEGEHALTPLKFIEDALEVEELRGTNLIRVRVTLRDPRTAAEASRRFAAKAIALTQQINQLGGASTQEQLKGHLTDARSRLASAEKELLTYKQGAQVELLKEDADAQLKERRDLPRLIVDIEAEKARLASALTEIKQQQPLLTSPRMTGSEDALRRAEADATAARAKDASATAARAKDKDADAKPARPKDADATPARPKDDDVNARKPGSSQGQVDSQHLDLTNAYVNPVYQTLDFQIAMSRTRIAALERERNELVNVNKIGGRELALLNDLYRREIEQARLQANFDLAAKVYDDLALRHEQSRTRLVGTTAQLQVIDEALPRDRPVSRRRLQYATFGAAAGLVLGVLLMQLLERRRV